MKKEKLQILLIEDNPGDVALIEDYLSEYVDISGLIHAKNYKEANIILHSPGVNFDVILLDLSLPDKSGEELIKEVLSLGLTNPTIVLTGNSDLGFGIRSLSMGISDYLLKDDINASSLYKSIIYTIERQRSRAELEESEKRYSDLFHLSPLPMWVYDVENLQIMDVNASAIKHYGFTQDEFLNMTIKDLRPEEDLEILDDTLQYTSKNDNLFFQGFFRHIKKNGELIQVDIQSNSILFKSKKAKVVLAQDITERLKYINAIEAQNKKLRDISWIQSHVVRAPIARLMSLIDLIQNSQNDENEKLELLTHILQSAHDLDGVVREISKNAEQIEWPGDKVG
jgi:PAS domain S-box-containing protein